MEQDTVDLVVDDWQRERPEIDARGLGITSRINLLRKVLIREDKRALAPLGLAPWACDVLLALRRQGPPHQLTPTRLRELTLLTSGAMTTRLDRLEESSLVTRKLDPDDRRSFQIRLTKKGRSLADRAIELRVGAAEKLLAPLSAGDRAAAAELLRKLLVGSGPE